MIKSIATIGNKETDTDLEKIQHSFLVYMGLLMSGGGLLWGTICVYYSLLLPSLIPYGYTALTAVNLTYFYFSKNFKLVRFIQVLMSLLLPFMFQWTLGGFVPTGAVMLWSMLALIGSLTFQDIKLSVKWLITYLFFTIFSGLIDSRVQQFGLGVSPEANTFLFVINIVVISTIVFGLIIYLIAQQDALNQTLEETLQQLQGTQNQLENQNAQLAQAKDEAERAQDEAERARSAAEEANQAKSVFLANMSHEIRTPMNAILGYAQIMDSDLELRDSHRKAIETIGSSGEHLLGLINDILDISKIEAGHEILNPTDFDLRGMINSLSNIFAMRCQQKGLGWDLDADLPAGRVYGDEGKLRQILINLLGNAVKFTHAGEVRFNVEMLGEHRYSFLVADTGPGIPKDKQASIFEPFQQEDEGMRQGGTGLGLAISMRHVQMMDGQIELNSTPGKGAEFSFALTLPPGQESPHEEDATDWSRVLSLADGHAVQALVVDDVETNRDILSQILSKIGVEVRTAENGADALEQVGRQMPDIIFADIRMPVMDGSQMLGHLFEQYGRKATVVVAVTASVFDHQRQDFLDMGFCGFLDKPLRTEKVYAYLSEHLGIAYTFSEEVNESAKVETDWTDIVLPADLHANLTSAVSGHSVTQLRQQLALLEGLGAKGQSLAAHLSAMAQQYDMNGIKIVLEKIESA